MTDARGAAFVSHLRDRVRGRVREGEPLARLSTYRIGGPATVFGPADEQDLVEGLRTAAASGVSTFVLGLGSNVLLPDQGMEALVVRLGKGLDAVEHDGPTWRLGAGLPAPLVARRTSQAGWAGLHMMVGVPGTVGGGIYMNAGCHGGQWGDVLRRVWLADRSGAVSERRGDQIPFRYRRSGLGDLVVLKAEVELRPGDPGELGEQVASYFAWREEGTPFNQPCCGSVFKNPDWPNGPPRATERTAGQLIEACGLKGLREGAVEVSPMHANYFVNTGSGTAGEVVRLMDTVRAAVRHRYGVELEPEVKVIGPRGEWLAEGATDE